MAKKNNNQVSAVRQAKHGWIWTLAFTVISILWIAPILVVLLNSFKRKAFIFRHPFTLGTEPLSAGWDKFIHGVERAFCGWLNYSNGIRKTNFWNSFGISLFITVGSVALIMYLLLHAHMEQQIIINATDPTVINREIPKLFQKFVLRIPLE